MEKSTEFARYLTNVVGYATNGIIVQVLFFLGGGGGGGGGGKGHGYW